MKFLLLMAAVAVGIALLAYFQNNTGEGRTFQTAPRPKDAYTLPTMATVPRSAPLSSRSTPNVQGTQIANLQKCQEAQAEVFDRQADYDRAVRSFGFDSPTAAGAKLIIDLAVARAKIACS